MSALEWWTRSINRVSAGLVAAAGVPATPEVQLVRQSASDSRNWIDRPLRLREQDLLRVRRPAGLEIRALQGHLWITQDGDTRDVVLRPGQAYRPDRNARVLVAPLGPAQVLVASGTSR